MKTREALNLLFDQEASFIDDYVGLLHWATQPPRLQKFEAAIKTSSRRLTQTCKEWAATQELPRREAQDALRQRLLTEAGTTTNRLAAAVGAALITLDRALNKVRDHGTLITLPSPDPFASAVYRLLQPAEHPIKTWIEEAGRTEIPRRAEDMRTDLAATLDLRWRTFPVKPNPFQVAVHFEDLPSHVAFSLRNRIEAKALTVGIAAPLQGLSYDFQTYPDDMHPKDGVPFRFKGVQGDAAEAKTEIESVLGRCRAQQIDVLMYPELTFDSDLLLFLRQQLEWEGDGEFPKMVIAGSFHEQALESGCYVNRTRVFDSLGREILQHDKLKRFRLTPNDLKKMAENGGSFDFEVDGGGFERIEQGQRLRVVDGPLGRMITSICLDFCGGSIENIARRSAGNLFWVPAMSPSLDEFHHQAGALGRDCRASTFVANSEWLLEAAGIQGEQRENLRSFCYLPFKGKSSKPQVDPEVSSLRLFKISEIIFNP